MLARWGVGQGGAGVRKQLRKVGNSEVSLGGDLNGRLDNCVCPMGLSVSPGVSQRNHLDADWPCVPGGGTGPALRSALHFV